MAKNKTTITPELRERLPGRGLSNKTRILNGIRAAAVMDVGTIDTSGKTESQVRELIEEKFWQYIATQATVDEKNGAMLLKAMLDKGWSNMKPVMESQQFDFDPEATQAVQARQILKAASDGMIAPDVAKTYLEAMASLMKVEEITDLKERLEKLEETLNG